MSEEKELMELTHTLIQMVKDSADRFENIKQTGESADFYTEVKPYCDEVKVINDQWHLVARNWVVRNKPAKLFSIQLDSTHEHIETIAVQSFFSQTSLTRFKNMISSTDYILNRLLQAMMKNESQ